MSMGLSWRSMTSSLHSIYKWLMQVFMKEDISKGVSFISSSRNHTGLEIENHSCCIRHCFKSYVTLMYQGWISPAKSLYKFFNGFLCHTREYPQMSDRDSNPITFLLRNVILQRTWQFLPIKELIALWVNDTDFFSSGSCMALV